MATKTEQRSAKLYTHVYNVSGGTDCEATGGRMLSDMNLSVRRYPALSPRPNYRTDGKTGNITGMTAVRGSLLFTAGGHVYYGSTYLSSIALFNVTFLTLGDITLFCSSSIAFDAEKTKVYVTTPQTGNLTYHIYKGTLGGASAGVNTMRADSYDLTEFYKPGDGIEVFGRYSDSFDGYYTVMEVNKATKELRFKKNAFGKEANVELVARVVRTPPRLDAACVCAGRAWGISGRKIYATSVGRVDNWYAYEYGKESSFCCEGPDGEPFTAISCVADKPVIFSPNMTYVMDGNGADNFKLRRVDVACGVPQLLRGSVAHSGQGVAFMSSDYRVRYFDGRKMTLLEGLPVRQYILANAGIFEDSYFLSLTDADANKYLYVYDFKAKCWHERDGRALKYYTVNGGHFLAVDGVGSRLVIDDRAYPLAGFTAEEEPVISNAVFSSFYPGREQTGGEVENRFASLKYIRISASVAEDSELSLYVRFDEDGEWKNVRTLPAGVSGTFDISVPQNSCRSWQIKLEGEGDYTVSDLQAFYTR